MWMMFMALAVAAGFGWAAEAQAQSRLDLERCRSINDGLRRLSCYDAIILSQPPPTRSKYEIVPLAELQAYALTYRGRFVEVTGWLTPGPDLFQLTANAGDENPLPVDVRAIDRRQRDAFAEQCGEGCDATIQGRVGPVGFTTGIAADLLIALGS
jgi:hypothetical protein